MSSSVRQHLRIRVQLLDDAEVPVGLPLTIVGREYWTLRKLIDAGETGVSSLENIGPRVSHYVFKLRGYGLAIETIIEKHGGAYPGHHARYMLHSKLRVLEDAGKLAA
ncbi:winged helix domain-containing protein